MTQINTYFSIILVFGCTSALYRSTLVQEDNKYPFIVSFRHADGSHAECGTIITKKHVLAHAWTLSKHKPKTLEAGSPVLGDGQVYDIEQSLIHPAYITEKGQNGIGLVWIKDEFTFGPSLQAAILSSETIEAGKSLEAIGWGRTEESRLSTRLREGLFSSLSDEKCKSNMEEAGWGSQYGKNILCSTGSTDPEQKWCWWDYGAPLVSKESGLVVGFIHNHKDCAENPNNINTATRIEPYLNWIRNSIRAKCYDIEVVGNDRLVFENIDVRSA